MAEANHDLRLTHKELEAILAEQSLRSSVISDIRGSWTNGQRFDARAFLEGHPELSVRKSVVLDVAYEEFCQRTEAGESLDPDSYCRRFPTYEKSVRRLLEVHQFLDENSHLLPVQGIVWPEAGQTFLGFSILAELGRGAFARVFLARELALGKRLVAVKVTTDGAAEAEILGKLRHPNIVPVYSVQQDAETALTVICMPYLGRATLFDVLDRIYSRNRKPTRSRSILDAVRDSEFNSLPTHADGDSIDATLRRGSLIDGAIHLGSQLAEALSYSHSNRVCHSDLKPSNVLITPQGRPMLLDFNLAFDQQAIKRRLGGTLPYMAPEQLLAIVKPHENGQSPVDQRSDVFSLGVILYELLSGRLPFGAIPTNRAWHEARTFLLERQESGPLGLRQANQDVDRPLADVVERCLAFDPESRPQGAAELAEELARSRAPVHRVRRWVRRHTPMAFSGVAFLLVTCFLIGYHFWTRDPYAVRMFNRAGEFLQEGEHSKAQEFLSRAVDSASSDRLLADTLLWRGRTLLESGKNLEAMRDFEQAAETFPLGEAFACRAYACAREGFSTRSIYSSNEAIAAGLATAETYNNLGWGYFSTKQYALALDALDKAIGLDPGLRSARYTRALAEFQAALREQRPMNRRAITDIEKAINSGPENAYMFYDAALIYSQVDADLVEFREKVVQYLCKAARLGVPPRTIRAAFPSLVHEPGLQNALEQSATVVRRSRTDHLADPFPVEAFPFR